MIEKWFCDWTPSERWPHYTRANAGEVLATPATPLGQTYSWENAMLQGWRDGYVRTGNIAEGEMAQVRPEAVGFFGGYFYINLSNVRMQGVRNPALTVEQLDMAFFGDHPDVPPYEPHPDDDRPDLVDGINAHTGWIMSLNEWPELDQGREETIALRANRPDISSTSSSELLARIREIQPLHHSGFTLHCLTSSGSGLAPGLLFAVGEAIGDPTMPMKVLAGLGSVDSAEPSFVLWDISRKVRNSETLTGEFDAGVEGLLDRLDSSDSSDVTDFLNDWNDFIFRFGCRGPNEWEVSANSWETRPELALALLDRVRLQDDSEAPEIRQSAKTVERQEVIESVRSTLAEMGNEELIGMFEGALVAGNMMEYRERTKTNLVRVINESRVIFYELGNRMANEGHLKEATHIFMLLDEELESFVSNPSDFTDQLAQRANDYEQLWTIEPPFFVKDGIVPPMTEWEVRGEEEMQAASSGEVLQGVPGCSGIYRGKARVVTDPADPRGLEPGEILVAPLTDPAWTPLFMTAGAVVVNVGGQISHAVIVSRELGLPCVVAATDATKRIPDGAEIEVNGDTGQVTLVS